MFSLLATTERGKEARRKSKKWKAERKDGRGEEKRKMGRKKESEGMSGQKEKMEKQVRREQNESKEKEDRMTLENLSFLPLFFLLIKYFCYIYSKSASCMYIKVIVRTIFMQVLICSS